MDIQTFLNEKNIKFFDINLDINGSQKKLLPRNGVMPTTNDFDKPLIKNTSSEYIAIDTREMLHIDVDFKDDSEYSSDSIEFVETMSSILPYYRSLTKMRGKHFFFETNAKLPLKKKVPN